MKTILYSHFTLIFKNLSNFPQITSLLAESENQDLLPFTPYAEYLPRAS